MLITAFQTKEDEAKIAASVPLAGGSNCSSRPANRRSERYNLDTRICVNVRKLGQQEYQITSTVNTNSDTRRGQNTSSREMTYVVSWSGQSCSVQLQQVTYTSSLMGGSRSASRANSQSCSLR